VTRRVVLATRSAGKLHELAPLLAGHGWVGVTLTELGVVETPAEAGIEVFDTFAENALAKARWFHAQTGEPTMADDSGLCVAALGGAPGVRSKRFSGRTDLRGQALDAANSAALMQALAGVSDRRAWYACAAAFVDGAREVVREGTVHGVITDAPRGAGGFGYDPWFVSDELGVTFAEASREAKEVVSHRGRAFRALFAALAAG
jgi:XTP/dITP diphosphohydrolase